LRKPKPLDAKNMTPLYLAAKSAEEVFRFEVCNPWQIADNSEVKAHLSGPALADLLFDHPAKCRHVLIFSVVE